MLFFSFFFTDYAFEMLNFFYQLCSKLCPIMPVNFARVYITILIEQEMAINDNIARNKKCNNILSLH